MRYSFHIAIMFCICFGCKSKVSQPDIQDGIIQAEPTNEVMPYFTASGTEPFWSLEISEDFIKFKTPSDSIIAPHSNPILAQDRNVKHYDVELKLGKMTIQITQTECTNGMSGKVSPYLVSMDFNKSDESQSQKLEGCGHYNTDYRLHDIWLLERLNDKTISKEDFGNEFPTMEIKASENIFLGFAGCNRMNGTIFFEKGLLRFTNVVTTRMMCETSNKEAEFLKTLQSSTTYSIENNRLTLSNPSGVLTVFKKID